MARTIIQVAEMQGLYGPYTLTERVLQRLWLHGDFDRNRLRLTDGRPLEVLAPGRWNLGGGPDFLGARLRVAGQAVTGDVEVHFHARDWGAHGHGHNPAFGGVVLHVLLFPPEPGEAPALTSAGVELPAVVLLPWLHRDLEEYASDDALEALTERDEWRRFAALAALPLEALQALLRRHAAGRWLQKTRYARLRLQRLGRSEAAHHTALEILGYRRNRPGMLALASLYPLPAWRQPLDPDELLAIGREFWIMGGQRPANHPRVRLRQYLAWVNARPDWPERMYRGVGNLSLPAASDGTVAWRRQAELTVLREKLAAEITGGAVSGSRMETLVCDGFLPLVAADTGRDLSACWQHWFLGDISLQVRTALRRLGVAGTPAQPFCHGLAQGLLGWILDHQSAASDWYA